MRLLIILSVLFSPLSFAGHHGDSKDNQIIFLLDLEVIEGKQSQVDDLIDRLVENVKKTEPDDHRSDAWRSQPPPHHFFRVILP